MDSLAYIFISMITLTGHSLVVNKSFKKEKIFNTSTLLIVSVLPSFAFSLLYIPSISYSASWWELFLIVAKESLYAITLFLRLESFKNLGAFGGGVLLVAQPVAIALFAWIFLGESLSLLEIAIIFATLSGIWIVNSSKPQRFYTVGKLLKYLTLPTILMAIVSIIDRYLLIGEMSAFEFFVIDKIIILPTFLVVFWFVSRTGVDEARISFNGVSKRYIFKTCLIVGGLWGCSTLFYGFALEQENTIWVVLISFCRKTSILLKASFNKKS